MTNISRGGDAAPLSINEVAAPLSEQEIAEVKHKFWATDVLEKSTVLKADQMEKLTPANPVLLTPGPEETIREPTLASVNIDQPKFTESDVPHLISGEQNSWIGTLGVSQGMDDEQLLHMRYFNDHRAEADPATLEFLASVDDNAFKGLKKDFQKIIKDPKVQMKQNQTDEANSALYLQNFKELIKHLPKDEQTAHLFAFSFEDAATPEMQAKVKPLKAEALAKTQKEAGIPTRFSPPLDTVHASDAITFEYKIAYEKEISDSGLSEADSARAKFANFHSDFVDKIEPQERGAYSSVKKINDRINAKIKQEMVERFSLPDNFNPLDDPLAKSSYNAMLNGEYVYQMLQEVGHFAESGIHPVTGNRLNRRQLKDIEYSMLRPNNPFADPEMQKIAAVLTGKMLPRIRAKYHLPSNFIPPIHLLSVLVAGSPHAAYLHKLIAAQISDAQTAIALAEEEPETPEGSDFMKNMKTVSDALGFLQSSIYSWQADDAELTKDFTIANMEAQIALLDAQRAQIEEMRNAKKPKKGKKTSKKILMVLNPVKTIVKLTLTNLPANCPLHVTEEQFDKHSSLGKIMQNAGPHLVISEEDWKIYNKYCSNVALEKIVVQQVIAPAVDFFKETIMGGLMKGIDRIVSWAVDGIMWIAVQIDPNMSDELKRKLRESLDMACYAAIIAAACFVGCGALVAGVFLPGILVDLATTTGLVKHIQPQWMVQIYAMIATAAIVMAAIYARNPAAAKAYISSFWSKKPPVTAADNAIELTAVGTKAATTSATATTTTTAAGSTSRVGRAIDSVHAACRKEMDRIKVYYDKLMKYADDADSYKDALAANERVAEANNARVAAGMRPSKLPHSVDDLAAMKAKADKFQPHLEKFLVPMMAVNSIGSAMQCIQEAKTLLLQAKLAEMRGEAEAFIQTLRALINSLSQSIQRQLTEQTMEGGYSSQIGNIQDLIDKIYQGYGGAVTKAFH